MTMYNNNPIPVHKDLMEYMKEQNLKDQHKLAQSLPFGNIDSSTTTKLKSSNMKEYLHNAMQTDMQDFAKGSEIQTGYTNLDSITNLYPGLYVLGAISSLGKTTFVHQMCDQLAASGKHVIYFSLEQSTLELASKSLSRIMAQKEYITALTSLQIRKNGTAPNSKVSEAINTYSSYADHITIVECDFQVTMSDIENFVNNYMLQENVHPIVVVDYLQVIQSNNPCSTTKDVTDTHVKRLKQLQKNNNLVMIVISSLNRQNYLSQIDYESFKESGGIEYTADVVWGLQLKVLHDPVFDKPNNINEKRQKVKEAKSANPREIELVCLKNRFGLSSYSCNFNYFSNYDLFVPVNNDLNALPVN